MREGVKGGAGRGFFQWRAFMGGDREAAALGN